MIRFISDISSSEKRKLKNKTAILRVDLNIEKKGVGKNLRFLSIFGTINFLLENGVKILILSHRGRPNIKIADSHPLAPTVPSEPAGGQKYSLRPFAQLIADKTKQKVIFISNFDFLKIRDIIKKSQCNLFLLENLRFFPGEENNSRELAKKLAALGDFYVNDAFSVCHRFNSSVVSLPKFLPAYAGFLLKKEIKNLDLVIQKINHPFVIILGGAKISDKLGVIQHFWPKGGSRTNASLLPKADYFLFGGGPANTLIAAKNLPVGKSLIKKNAFNAINKFLNSPKIILPIDVKIKNEQILDIGVKTINHYQRIIQKAKTVIWSGPMGLYEKKGFEKGTKGIWEAILNNKRAIIVIGGGDTLASLPSVISDNQRLFLSTGGGAMLKYLAGEKIPGIEILK